MELLNNISAWLVSHITGVIIGGSTIGTAIAFVLFGIIGAFVAWGMYGILTLLVSKKQKDYIVRNAITLGQSEINEAA